MVVWIPERVACFLTAEEVVDDGHDPSRNQRGNDEYEQCAPPPRILDTVLI